MLIARAKAACGLIAGAAGWLACCLAGCLSGCSGVEGDVLSLRQLPDLAPAADLSAPAADLPPRCSTQALSARMCTDLGTWKLKAEDTCRALGGLLLGRFTLDAVCGFGPMGPSGALGVHFECCRPLPPPPPLMCSGRVQGDLTSCKDAVTWQQSAAIDCTSRGERVEALTLVDECAVQRYRYVRYQCCTPPPEARPRLGSGPAAQPGLPSDPPAEISESPLRPVQKGDDRRALPPAPGSPTPTMNPAHVGPL
ncbi:MAG: hypothetical protein U1A78_07250 [Polyangia bacterium]